MPRKKDSPSYLRESTLSKIIQHLGHTETEDERFNNGYAHHSLPVHSSFIRAFETRMGTFVSLINVDIIEATPIPGAKNADPSALIGQSITVKRSIFENTMTLTQWIQNFYQESPSINARAREDQKGIGENAFKVPAHSGFQPWGHQEEGLEADE